MSNQREELRRLKLESAQDRCEAIRQSLQYFQGRIESSPATRKVIDLVLRAVRKIEQFIVDESTKEDVDLLTDNELESRIHRVTQIIPAVHGIVGIVERSDVTSVPAEIAAPLRREIKDLFGNDAELIVTSSPELNYSVQSFRLDEFKELLNLEDEDVKDFPRLIFIASLPSIEYDQALQHCNFAHELSHPLWEEFSIESLLPSLVVDKKQLNELAENLAKQVAEPETEADVSFEALAKVILQQRVQQTTVEWCIELTSDLFGLARLGPAFLFSLIYFICSFERLDYASDSHPPSRLRLKMLFRFLDILYPKLNPVSGETKAFLTEWRSIAEQSIDIEDQVHQLVLNTMSDSNLYDELLNIVNGLLPQLLSRYTMDRYENDLKRLCPLIDAQIPPFEWLSGTAYEQATFAGILNAGWECYLQNLKQYQSRLPQRRRASPYDVKRSFNSFLLKALELNEASRAWENAKQ